MSIKKLGLIGLCCIITACSTGRGEYGYRGESSTSLGVRYSLGRGLPQNNEKAFYYFNRAANEGDPFAQNEVAYMYASGKGTPRDYGKALVYYRRAANHGLASAQYSLGLMYAHGLGTPRNPELAHKWFSKSAAAGFEPAQIAVKKY